MCKVYDEWDSTTLSDDMGGYYYFFLNSPHPSGVQDTVG